MMDKKNCCGCTACMHICPVKCIEMKEDAEGFLYPVIDKKKCVNCHKCENVCPIKNTENYNAETKTFVGYNKDESVRNQSSSGGIFSLAADWILSQNGVVFGAAFDENFEVCHIAAQTQEELSKLRTSKYVQSRLGDAYPLVKQYLENNRKVLFTGTACQIAGLKNYLQNDYENLYTVDVLCHGVPSPKIWKMYIEHKKKQFNAPIEKIEFRSKESGWKSYSFNMEFSDNRRYCVKFHEDKYMQMFLGNIDLRPSCYACRFKGFPRISDMTIGDSWGIESYMPDMDDDMGTSVILVHSQKGVKLLDAVRQSLNLRDASLDKALPITAESRKSVEMHPNRKKFFKGLSNGESFEELCAYVPKSFVQRLASFIRYMFMRVRVNVKH